MTTPLNSLEQGLPAELWIQIFLLAADEDVLSVATPFPTALAPSAWFQHALTREWLLRTPEEALEALQRRSYATKTAIALTCKYFLALTRESCLQFRTLFLSSISSQQGRTLASSLIQLSTILSTSASSPSPGTYTRRLHITSPLSLLPSHSTEFENAMIGILRHAGHNLESLVLRIPILHASSFGRIAHSICAHSRRTLSVLHIQTSSRNTGKCIWTISSLTSLRCLHIELTATASHTLGERSDLANEEEDEGEEKLGSASSLPLVLPQLTQLSLSGSFSTLLTAASDNWTLPMLNTLSLYTSSPTVSSSSSLPSSSSSSSIDIPAFLTAHGSQLVYLDINTTSPNPVPLQTVLDLCPLLKVFAFNADLRYEPAQQQAGSALPDGPGSENVITSRQHPNIACIGLHGLGSAFTSRSSLLADSSDDEEEEPQDIYGIGIGIGGGSRSRFDVHSTILRSRNDTLFSSIVPPGPWKPFPNLRVIRVLSRSLLMTLERNDGPSEGLGGGRERWERWWDACTNTNGGVRLEDCTGAQLGELPDGDDLSDDDDEEGDSEEDEEDEFDVPPRPESPPANERVAELRALLEECRASEEEGKRDTGMFGMMGMGMGMPMSGMPGMMTPGGLGPAGFAEGFSGQSEAAGFAAYYQATRGSGS